MVSQRLEEPVAAADFRQPSQPEWHMSLYPLIDDDGGGWSRLHPRFDLASPLLGITKVCMCCPRMFHLGEIVERHFERCVHVLDEFHVAEAAKIK